jgi:hypothetical protein
MDAAMTGNMTKMVAEDQIVTIIAVDVEDKESHVNQSWKHNVIVASFMDTMRPIVTIWPKRCLLSTMQRKTKTK